MNTTISRLAGALLLLAIHTPAMAATPADAQEIVKQSTEQVLKELRTEGESIKKRPERLYQIVNNLILPHFDFRQMSKWVLGRYWSKASEKQRVQFTKQFELLLVSTYSDALVEFRNETVAFLPTRTHSDTEVTVRSTLNRNGGAVVPIIYRMHKVDRSWKVYDVAIDGVSLVITYRSSFAQEISRNGIDGLIQRLVQKNQSARG